MILKNCYIRKNTKELRKKLRELGYLDNTCFTSFDNFLYTLGDNYYTCKNYKKFSDMRSEEFVSRCIDCGTNEDLFLAIAALRDDSDYMQWFVTESDQSWVNIGTFMPKGSFFQCLTEHRYPEEFNGKEKFCSSVVPSHKATIEELIEHFK